MKPRGPAVLMGRRGAVGGYAEALAAMAPDILREAGARLGLSDKHEISLTLCGAAPMRTLNRRWRGKDKTTDVLSFPLCDLAPGRMPPPGALGDIVLALPVARRAAREGQVGFERHCARLLIHGLLHLLGYDHEDDEAAAEKMESLEEKLLGKTTKALSIA